MRRLLEVGQIQHPLLEMVRKGHLNWWLILDSFGFGDICLYIMRHREVGPKFNHQIPGCFIMPFPYGLQLLPTPYELLSTHTWLCCLSCEVRFRIFYLSNPAPAQDVLNLGFSELGSGMSWRGQGKMQAQRVNNTMDEDTDREVHSMSSNRLLASSGIRPWITQSDLTKSD